MLQEHDRPNRFVILEAWTDDSSFRVHEDAKYTAQFRSSLAQIHDSPYDQRVHHDFAVAPRSDAPASGALYVVTQVDVPPPRKDETEILLKAVAAQTRMVEGNLLYAVCQQSTRPNRFTIVAVWKSEESFDLNGTTRHTQEFREALGPMWERLTMSAYTIRLQPREVDMSPLTRTIALVGLAVTANGQELVTQRNLSLPVAKIIAETALAACREKGYHTAVAVVDRAGQVMVILRDEQADPITVEMARRKAYTARMFRSTTLDRLLRPVNAAKNEAIGVLRDFIWGLPWRQR